MIGSVCVSEEDEYGNYSRLLLKYYLAEGVLNKHHLHVSSAGVAPHQLMQVIVFVPQTFPFFHDALFNRVWQPLIRLVAHSVVMGFRRFFIRKVIHLHIL